MVSTRNRLIALLAIVLLAATAGVALAAGADEKAAAIDRTFDRSGPKVVDLDTPIQTNSTRAIGTIQYDTGTVTGTPSVALASLMAGNQFNTALGAPVTANGTVTQVQFYMANLGGTAAFVSMYGPPAGTVAPKITSLNVSGVALGFNTIPYSFGYTGPSFLLGVWLDSAASDLVGLDNNTGGQGFHGIAIDDAFPGTVGTNFQTIGAVNAIVRPTGNIVVPVELMTFSVDEN